ncbi:MAG: cupin domain-containing protein [Actinomycetota bacterium]
MTSTDRRGAINPHVQFHDEAEFVEVRPGMRRRIVTGEHLSVWLWRIHESTPQSGLHEHRDSEQFGYIAAGRLEFQIGDGERVTLGPGDSYVAPKGVVHGGSIFHGDPDRGGEVWIVDVFAPPRGDDYNADRGDLNSTNGAAGG